MSDATHVAASIRGTSESMGIYIDMHDIYDTDMCLDRQLHIDVTVTMTPDSAMKVTVSYASDLDRLDRYTTWFRWW